MKNVTKMTLLFAFICTISLVSCSSDDDTNATQNTDLVGVWQRSDAGETNEDGETHDYKFYIDADYSGYRTYGISYADGTAISGVSFFTWSTNGNMITVDFEGIDADFTSTYTLTSEGQLLLSDLTDLPFNEM
jgi:hypothetical protein